MRLLGCRQELESGEHEPPVERAQDLGSLGYRCTRPGRLTGFDSVNHGKGQYALTLSTEAK